MSRVSLAASRAACRFAGRGVDCRYKRQLLVQPAHQNRSVDRSRGRHESQPQSVDCRYKRQFLVKPAQLKRVGLYDRDAIAPLHFDGEGLGAGDLNPPSGSRAMRAVG